jgi:hypothetical protein
LVWIAEWWSSSLSSRNPKDNWCLSRIFGVRFGEKDHGLSTCKPWTEQAGGWINFCMEQLRTLNSYKIFKIKKKILKTYSCWWPFKVLSNDTTLMQIQSGRTVPCHAVFLPKELQHCFYSHLHKQYLL